MIPPKMLRYFLLLAVFPSIWALVHTHYFAPVYWHSESATSSNKYLSPQLWPSWSSTEFIESSVEDTTSITQIKSKVIVIGDTRASASGLGPSARWPSLTHAFKKHDASILVHLGDWVQDGSSPREWQQSLASLSLLDQMKLITVRGNHDRGGLFEKLGFNDVPNTALRMTMVGSILFFLLDSEVQTKVAQSSVDQLFEQGKIKPKLRSLLSKSKARVWIQHRPVWSSGNHGSDERNWRHWLVPKLEALKIDLMLSGHDHDYERFCPSMGIDEQRRCDSRGITYIVSGGGATVTVPLPNLSWKQSAKLKRDNDRQRLVFSDQAHYLYLEVKNKSLNVEAWTSRFVGQRQRFDQVKIPLKMNHFTR
ncbi:MAG: hypothetical protein CMH49_01010 [Myxococcales bacterium]|nr:hypothetical protein [Myxococcales bacterium]